MYEDGWTITIVGWLIVITALALLVIIFITIPKIINYFTNRKLRKKGVTNTSITAYEATAIATAIFLYNEDAHEDESNIITVKKIIKRYSPWNSKIYSVLPNLDKKFNKR